MARRVVIADAGPLIALAKVDLLHVLVKLFGRVYLPSIVQQECMAKTDDGSCRIAQAIEDAVLIVEDLAEKHYLILPRSLGHGEKQAISLAARHDDALLILDDRLARKQAARLGIAFVGTVRLLVHAEQKGVIDSAEAIIKTMRERNYRISPEILKAIRREQ